MWRSVVHLLLHAAVPGVAARTMFRRIWKRAWIVMLATMLVDLDHLLANPVYDPERCSIGFHPLHSFAMIPVYAVFALVRKTRLVGTGLLIHMTLDALDCLWMKLD